MKVILHLCLQSTCSMQHLEAVAEPGQHCMMYSHNTSHVIISLKDFIYSLMEKEGKKKKAEQWDKLTIMWLLSSGRLWRVLQSLCSGNHLKCEIWNEAPLKTSSFMRASFPLAFVLVQVSFKSGVFPLDYFE